MIQFLVAFVGGIVTLVPVFFVSPRRRELHFVRDEAAILKEMPEGKGKRLMEAAHTETVEAYRRRVKGLDRVAILRRRNLVMLPVMYVVLTASTAAMYARADIAGQLGIKEFAVAVVVLSALLLFGVPFFLSTVQMIVAMRARDRQVEAQVEEFEIRVATREAARQVRESLATEKGRRAAEAILAKSKSADLHFRKTKDGEWVAYTPKPATKFVQPPLPFKEPDATDGGIGVPVG